MLDIILLMFALVTMIYVIYIQILYKQITIRGVMTVIAMVCIIMSIAIDIVDAITITSQYNIDESIYVDRIIEEDISNNIRQMRSEMGDNKVEIKDNMDIYFDNEYDEMIYQATKDTVVDPYLAIAISRLETGNYTSDAFLNDNNFGGMTGSDGVMSFPSKSNGLDRYVIMLEWYYEMGMNTPQKMQPTYCPPNDDWDDIVIKIYNKLM